MKQVLAWQSEAGRFFADRLPAAKDDAEVELRQAIRKAMPESAQSEQDEVIVQFLENQTNCDLVRKALENYVTILKAIKKRKLSGA
jgi:hypothetical protein